MKNTKSFVTICIILIAIVLLGWYFSDIVIYMLLALGLSFLGKPLMRLLAKIKIKNWQFPTSLAAVITLVCILACISLAFIFLIPAIINEFSTLMTIDPTSISSEFENWLNHMDPMLRKYGFLSKDEHFSSIVINELSSWLDKISLSELVSNTTSIASALFIGLFSVLFMTFFALKDHGIFFRMIGEWIPSAYRNNFSNILNDTGKQLSSYFIGVFIDMLFVGIIETLLCLIFRVPNALLIGTIGGLLNIIPFVGPIIAVCISVVISLTSLIPTNPESAILVATLIKVVTIFCATKLIDDFILQPNIYGKRTQTHPLEIFIVILMAGQIGGVFAMIFAVPAYTLLRIVVKEFFGAYFFKTEGDEGESVSR